MPSIDDVFIELESVFDPELMVNIVDLGLIYDVEVKDKKVIVRMTLTSPACPVSDIIKQEVIENILLFEDVEQAEVEFVWDPPWHTDMMSEEAKIELGVPI